MFTRYLLGRAPTPYVLRQYAAAHDRRAASLAPKRKFDALTVRLAASGGFFARCTDAYCRVFRPRGALRQKLVLTLAILEVSPPFHRDADEVRGPPLLQVAILARSALAFVLSLVLGTIVLLPLQLVVRGGDP